MGAATNMLIARAQERNESEKQTLLFSRIFFDLAETVMDSMIGIEAATKAVENPPIIRFGK